MKTGLLASVSIAALFIASGAGAADLAVKARPMVAPAPVYSWTGCYVGAHGGWGWGKNHTTQFSSFSGPNGSFVQSGGHTTSGALFGGQVGCNYQFAGPWVIGIQGDFAGTDINGRGADPRDPNFDTIGVKTDWLASVTGRVGYSFYDNQGLFYVKGGGAWVHNKWDLHDADFSWTPLLPSETKTGWTVGVGTEWKFTQNWSGFIEYNYYSFNNNNNNNGFGGGKVIATDFEAILSSNKQTLNTVKVGVNYSFWGFGGPVVARY